MVVNMDQLILIFHVLAGLAIIGLIMLQQGKGADMGASFGSGSSQTLFGSSGNGNALTKATALLVTLFFATSFGLAVVAKNMAASGGLVDIPVPSVVESTLPAANNDLPVIEQQSSGTDTGLDIPAAAGSSADIPIDSGLSQGDDIPN